jgi:hypothetical protein
MPVRVRRADGTWAGTDATLVRTGDGWTPGASQLDVTVSNGGPGPFATYRAGGQTITLSWQASTAEHPGDLARVGQVALSTAGSDLTVRLNRCCVRSSRSRSPRW